MLLALSRSVLINDAIDSNAPFYRMWNRHFSIQISFVFSILWLLFNPIRLLNGNRMSSLMTLKPYPHVIEDQTRPDHNAAQIDYLFSLKELSTFNTSIWQLRNTFYCSGSYETPIDFIQWSRRQLWGSLSSYRAAITQGYETDKGIRYWDLGQ